jgi:predicted signal transduction protein with EAL and GGDEF domain
MRATARKDLAAMTTRDLGDVNGHAVGDQVLKDRALLLQESLRSQGLVARWGGGEFLILLPDTDRPGGEVAAEKIRGRGEQMTFYDDSREFHLTMSFGVAVYLWARPKRRRLHQGRRCRPVPGQKRGPGTGWRSPRSLYNCPNIFFSAY